MSHVPAPYLGLDPVLRTFADWAVDREAHRVVEAAWQRLASLYDRPSQEPPLNAP